MEKKKITTRAKIITALVLIMIGLTVRTLIFGRETTKIEDIVTDTFHTIEYNVISRPIKFVSQLKDEINEIRNVYEENKILRRQLDSFAIVKSKNDVLTDEIEQLKEQLHLTCLPSEYTTKTTNIITRDYETWSNEVMINLGSVDDIQVNMAVIDSNGLIGYISSVKQFSSVVTLLTSENLSKQIPIKIKDHEGNDCYGLLKKYDANLNSYMIEMFTTSEFDIDTAIYTSGLGGDIPEGILIGYVNTISDSNYQLNPVVMAKVAGEYDSLKYVSVVQRSDLDEQTGS